jgi:hypothetical protein
MVLWNIIKQIDALFSTLHIQKPEEANPIITEQKTAFTKKLEDTLDLVEKDFTGASPWYQGPVNRILVCPRGSYSLCYETPCNTILGLVSERRAREWCNHAIEATNQARSHDLAYHMRHC